MGKLSDAILREFGFPVREEFAPHGELLVANTAKLILREHPDRLNWDIFNLGTTVVYLSHEPAPTSTNGYYLDKNGGHIGMNYKEDNHLVGMPIYAISTGTPTLFVKAVVGI